MTLDRWIARINPQSIEREWYLSERRKAFESGQIYGEIEAFKSGGYELAIISPALNIKKKFPDLKGLEGFLKDWVRLEAHVIDQLNLEDLGHFLPPLKLNKIPARYSPSNLSIQTDLPRVYISADQFFLRIKRVDNAYILESIEIEPFMIQKRTYLTFRFLRKTLLGFGLTEDQIKASKLDNLLD